jgi:hypothetical protein
MIVSRRDFVAKAAALPVLAAVRRPPDDATVPVRVGMTDWNLGAGAISPRSRSRARSGSTASR